MHVCSAPAEIAAANGSRQPNTFWKGETLANVGRWRKGNQGSEFDPPYGRILKNPGAFMLSVD